MNHMVFVLCSGIIRLDLKLTKLSAIIPPYLAKFLKHNKSNTTCFHAIATLYPAHLFAIRRRRKFLKIALGTRLMGSLLFFSHFIYWRPLNLLETTWISSFNLRTSPQGKTIQMEFIDNADSPNKFSSSVNPSTSKFLI